MAPADNAPVKPASIALTSRRALEIIAPTVLTGAGFWVLQRLELMADTPWWVLALMIAVTATLTETVRAVAPKAMRVRVVLLVGSSAAVIYGTGWGPVLVVGFMYGVTASVRTFGARATAPAVVTGLTAIVLGQVAIAVDVAPSVIGEGRLAHGLATLGGLGLLFPSWVVYTTAARKEESERQLVHQAFYDPLSGLPNRRLFLNRLDQALADAVDEGTTLAVVFGDLDRFKVVNDSLGHDVGDLLLSAVADRIAECVRPTDTVARLGGDEFVVLLEDVDGVEGAELVADRIHDELRMPFFLGGYEVVARISLGIALARGAGDAEQLVRDADLAMYHAKSRGGGSEVFTEEMGVVARRRLEVEGRLRRAIDREELGVVYQAEVALGTGEVVGVEALVRWVDPESGEVPLEDVIAVAEETGLILPLGRWVLDQAAREAATWYTAGLADGSTVIAVNISARQFQQPDLIDQVSTVLGSSGLEARRLRLEITESAVVRDGARGVDLVHDLKSLGVQIALDDFGTGHSSLSALSTLPADVLKLDRSFVHRLGEPHVPAIIEAVVAMAHELGLRVVGEGVETPDQLRMLGELGCDSVQGYLLSHPVPGDEARALLESGSFPLARLPD